MNCRSCDSLEFDSILDLGSQPWCNNFLIKEEIGFEPTYPLHLIRCKKCTLLQLDYTVPKEIMFSNHSYVSGTTNTLKNHFKQIGREVIDYLSLSRNDLILDIGGNDGTQLLQYKELGYENLINIESASNIAKIAMDNGIFTINRFFNLDLVKEKISKNSVRVVNASGVFFHLEELHSAIEAIKYILREDGIFVCQFMYAGDMLDKTQYDTIYHEHLCYYTLQSFKHLVEGHGLVLKKAMRSEIHGGSIIAFVSLSNNPQEKDPALSDMLLKDTKYTLDFCKSFSTAVEKNKKDLIRIISNYNTVYGLGAPAKGNTLLNYCKLSSANIQKIFEKNPLKYDTWTPGTHIPVIKENRKDTPEAYLLLAHNFVKEITSNLTADVIIPFPTPYIYDITSNR